MQKNMDFIDRLRASTSHTTLYSSMLQGISTSDSELFNKEIRIKKIQKCQSFDLSSLNKITQIPSSQLKASEVKAYEPEKSVNASMENLNGNISHISGQFELKSGPQHSRSPRIKTLSGMQSKQMTIPARNDQIIFQIKLKLASFLSKFRSDSSYLSTFRENSIEQILQQVVRKLKQFTKEHEKIVNKHNQIMKHKQIQNLNLKTKVSSLEEHICQQTNKWTKKIEKFRDENQELQRCLDIQMEDNQQLEQNVFMLQSIIKQQNQYIKDIQSNKRKQADWQLNSIENQAADLKEKLKKMISQHFNMEIANQKYREENDRKNIQIRIIKQQSKQYEDQCRNLNQKLESYSKQLEINQEKLIAYYDRYQMEVQKNSNLIQSVRESELKKYLDQKQELNKAIQQKIKDIIEQWRLKLKSTVEYYQKLIQDLQIEIQKKQETINRISISHA